MSSTLRTVQGQSHTQYISLVNFDQAIYTYTQNFKKRTGTLTLTGVSSDDAAGLVLLRDTGQRLFPGVHPGVSTPMISIGFVGASSGIAFTGFIDPQNPSYFAPYTENGTYANPISSDLYTSGLNTTGPIVAGGETSGLTLGILSTINLYVGGTATIEGTVNINANSVDGNTTTIATGGTGPLYLGNSTGNVFVMGAMTVENSVNLPYTSSHFGVLTDNANNATLNGNVVSTNCIAGTISLNISIGAGTSMLVGFHNSTIQSSRDRLFLTAGGIPGTSMFPFIAGACQSAGLANINVGNPSATSTISGTLPINYFIVNDSELPG